MKAVVATTSIGASSDDVDDNNSEEKPGKISKQEIVRQTF